MVRVAIAGGTGAMGRTFAEVLQNNSEHEAWVLSRKVNENGDQRTIRTDYSSVSSLKACLDAYSIEVVIAAFHMSSGALQVAQLNLIEACDQARSVKRFIPTSFAVSYPREAISQLPSLKFWFEALDRLEKSGLEWTIVNNGLFLDYYAPTSLKTNLPPNYIAIDVENAVAAIPGDGNVPVTFTYTYDVAKYIVAALDLEKWDRETRIVGDTMTWNEFVEVAEQVLDRKFKVTNDNFEKLRKHEVTELPSHKKLYAQFPKPQLQYYLSIFELWTAEGRSHMATKRSPNGNSPVDMHRSLDQVFPEITPMKVRDVVEMHLDWEIEAY